ncbi:site-specific integrase [Vibrio sp. B1Z05]|uniref:site-specific integrase n=1 Tax=Vibrio sp. B1Z05 TaxID=2654980 RepID=UPI00128B1B9E|nr:site-specific integrase [Vibrio sp. B1Z05]MPW37290.1 tyrosine-type recombinase/integrase [Vibrio sp. B1Z05]
MQKSVTNTVGAFSVILRSTVEKIVAKAKNLRERNAPLESMLSSYSQRSIELSAVNIKDHHDERKNAERRANTFSRAKSNANRKINRVRILCHLAGIKDPSQLNEKKAIAAIILFGELPRVITQSKYRDYYTCSRENLLQSIEDFPNEPRFCHKTKFAYAQAASSVFGWAENNYDTKIKNSWRSIVRRHAIGESIKGKRLPFTEDELILIFNDALFTKGKISFSNRTGKFCNYQYWLPIIALELGLRGNEIAQLRRSNIVKVGEDYLIKINSNEPDQWTKNQTSEREVPVTKTMVRLGFIEFIELLSQDERLFSELKYYPKDGYYKNAGEWFRRKFQGILKENKGFHSFRHNFAQAMFESNVVKHKASSFMGHSNKSITIDLYGGDWRIEDLKAVQESTDFEGVLKAVLPYTETKAYRALLNR